MIKLNKLLITLFITAGLVLWVGCSVTGNKKITLTFNDFENGLLIIRSSGLKEPVVLTNGGSVQVPSGVPVAVNAVGDPGYDLGLWDGSDSTDKSLYFTPDSDRTLGAEFYTINYMVSLDENPGGKVTTDPAIIQGKTYPANSVMTIKAQPDKGYVIDSLYSAVPGPMWVNYLESPDSAFQVKITSDMTVGASFVKAEEVAGITVKNNIVYAQPGVKPLKYDVYSPDGATNLPLIIIVHGGGWSSNSEDVMRGMAREIARTSKYVVASVDYRWIGNLDGDVVPNTMFDLIDDVYGAIAHVMEHASEYGADPSRIAVTGDSAGGHLSASVATMIERLGTGKNHYTPTYLPEGMTVEQFRDKLASSLKAVAPSYGVFDRNMLGGFIKNLPEDAIPVVCPIDNIPQASKRSIPHFLIRGTKDPLITDASVQAYTDALKAAGQTAEYVQVEGASHAFYDWKPDKGTKATFAAYGVSSIHKMLAFFDLYL